MVFSKRDMIFPVLSKKVVFFPENMVFFPRTENERKMTFLKKYSETWYFVFDMFHAPNPPPREKNQGQSYHAKIHLKVVDIPDQHPGKDSSNSLYLHADLYRRFHTVQQKKTGNLIYKIEVSSSIYSVGDIPQWIIFNTLYHSSLRSCI